MINVNYKEYERVIEWTIRNNRITMIKGAPGTGKSQIAVRVIQDILGINKETVIQRVIPDPTSKDKVKVQDVNKPNQTVEVIDAETEMDTSKNPIIEERLYQRGPYAAGLATIQSNETKWTIPEWISEIKKKQSEGIKVVLLLDDFHLTIPSVMNVTYQLFEKYQINGHIIKKIPIIILGNFDLKSAEGFPVQSPIMGRLTGGFYELTPDIETFIEFAAKSNRLHESVISFLQTDPNFLYDADPKSMVMTYSPRNWENFSKAIFDNHPVPPKHLAKAFVGPKAGTEFANKWDSLTISERELFEMSGNMRRDLIKTYIVIGRMRRMIYAYLEGKDPTLNSKQDLFNRLNKYYSKAVANYKGETLSVFITQLIDFNIKSSSQTDRIFDVFEFIKASPYSKKNKAVFEYIVELYKTKGHILGDIKI